MGDIRNCPKCGGTHYGSNVCPMTEGNYNPKDGCQNQWHDLHTTIGGDIVCPVCRSAFKRASPTTHVAIERGELEMLRGALQEIVDLGNKTLLGPRHDTERFHELGSAKAYADCADIARAALAKEPKV